MAGDRPASTGPTLAEPAAKVRPVHQRVASRPGSSGHGTPAARRPVHVTDRWYNDYQLPDDLGSGTISIRLHGNADDARRRFNRTENIRLIPPTDPDFRALYRRRNDAESINRALDDTLWLRRAHSIGHRRQHLNQLTHALGVNALARHRHHQRIGDPPLPAAA